MSLEDRFYHNDGSFIDNIDAAMIKLHKKVGDLWQKKTYKSADGLRRGLHIFSAASMIPYIVAIPDYLLVPPAIVNILFGTSKILHPRKTDLKSELSTECEGLPRKFGKYSHASLYFLSAGCTLFSAAGIGIGTINDDEKIIRESIEMAGYGLAFLSWGAANYLYQSNFGPPPNKPERKSIKEIVRGIVKNILPEPAIQANTFNLLD